MSVKIGVLGYGYWGPNLVRCLNGTANARVTMVADINPERVGDVTIGGVVRTADPRRLIESSDVEAVVVATPAATHFELARAALLARKHVLVEKPLALSVADAEELTRLATREQRTLMVGHTFLFSPAVQRLRKYLLDGELGRVYHIHCERLGPGRVRRDVNALWNFAPHDISILLYLLGRSPVEVQARASVALRHGLEDIVHVDLGFAETNAHIHISWLHPVKIRKMTLVGSRRMLVYDDVSIDAKLTIHDCGVDAVPTSDAPRDFDTFIDFQVISRSSDVMIPMLDRGEPLARECAHFVDCIRSGRTPLADGPHGVEVVRVLEAAQHSLEASRTEPCRSTHQP
jgi:predicted dehydrogenase